MPQKTSFTAQRKAAGLKSALYSRMRQRKPSTPKRPAAPMPYSLMASRKSKQPAPSISPPMGGLGSMMAGISGVMGVGQAMESLGGVLANILSPPDRPIALGAGGGGGYAGGGYYPSMPSGPKEITWSKFDYRPKNAPSWWNAMKPSAGGPETEQIALMNMMIPFLSPQDQRAVAQRLAVALPKYFGSYTAADIPSRHEPSEQQQEYMLSAQRAGEALGAASAYSKAMGKEEMGSPYQFMQQVLGGIRAEVPTEGRMSRGAYMGLMERMAPLYGDKAMGGLAQMMAEPGYEQSILPGRKASGKFYWGQANPLLYR